jgi:leucyl aminopeptidase
MDTIIKKATKVSSKDNIIILSDSKLDFNELELSKEEKAYLKKEIEKGKKIIILNQYNRLVIFCIPEIKKNHFSTLDSLRNAGNKIAKVINENGIEQIVISDKNKDTDYILALAEGIALSNYQFLKYFTKPKTNSLRSIALHGPVKKERVEELQTIVDSTFIARDLVNEPVCYLDAVKLASEAQALGKKHGFTVEVFNKTKIESLKMGGLLAVNKGSKTPPTFTIMEYKPKNAKNKKPYVLVGKGVVFDTGGVNIKVQAMEFMKCDMGGAAAVIGAMTAIAKEKLPVYVIALVPATDNKTGENAYVPGDILTMFDGSTVEVLNTDAEGRLILADALAYAKKYKPELVIDIATLTGASMRAIGNLGICAMGTSEEKLEEMKVSGFRVHERIAEMPFWDDYDEMIKSSVADIKNIGGALAGAITAGKFLQHFTDYPWMHLDIAGPSFNEANDSYRGIGGTGYGVRLLYDFIKNQN